MIILSIESSCDETAVAILEIINQKFKVLANFVASQINIHKKYGGVVPEVAARKHLENMLPILDKAMKQAKIKQEDIDAIGVVYGPGLITSLIVGVETAKTLAMVWNKPLIPVNHVKAHILANYLKGDQGELEDIKYPALCLVVSGGHTSLVLLNDPNNFKTIGSTRDDAVGEAFDKAAKIMGLGYPGGPIISKHAANADKDFYKLPRPMIYSKDFDFSFSGLKTAVRNEWEKVRFQDEKAIRNMCAAFQQASIDVLVAKTLRAAEKYEVKSLLLGGGVAANKELRKQLSAQAAAKLPQVKFFQPDLHLTTDNALMVAVAAYFEAQHGLNRFSESWRNVKVDPNLNI
ncbi:MAG: tRNA (adenosine(37)-N6)-threonylcarbamoyltransferase complex transferase subunit TsaD [Candidatus Parcubacteria bacterium]|nr:tRNA (adenosine(37)-N6)-threonylcarbamoyltransferase complex transferase subunit TsaD [Candidatus Parcubacteria bacterium]